MAQLDEALTDTRLTTLGRLNAVSAIIARYKQLTGKSQLRSRQPGAAIDQDDSSVAMGAVS
jgi:hypothetical protein